MSGQGGTIGSAAFRAMMDAGLSQAQMLAIIEGLEADRKPADRTNAERQARHRTKKSNGVTVTPAPPLNDSILIPPVTTSVISSEMTAPVADLKPEHVVEAWNATAERVGLKSVRKFTPQRQRKLLTRIKQNTIDEFTEAISAIERSPFLRGENDRGWRADFDWMLEPKNFTKLIEGTYDR